ncbi:MAG: hypothetical protein ACNS62_19610 [Candidatus Cyclobacteriaceae bacterium M3_2C_046]
MKKFFFLVLAIAILGGGYYYYTTYLKPKDLQIWSLVPGNAIMVYETYNMVSVWNHVLEKPLWHNLSSVAAYRQMENQLEALDSISGQSGNIDKVLSNNALLISLHVTSKDQFDFLYYFKIKDLTSNEVISEVLRTFNDNPSLIKDNRNFLGQRIYQFKQPETKKIFSYVLINDYFIGSYTPFLVEDAIRNVDDKMKTSFWAQNPFFERISKIQTDEGNIYLDFNKVHYLFNLFTGMSHNMEGLKSFTGSTFYDLKVSDQQVLLNGSSNVPADSARFFLHTFLGQNPGQNQIKQLLPNRTAFLHHFTFDDPVRWQTELENYWRKNDPQLLKMRQQLFQKLKLQEQDFFSWIDDEIGHATLESIDIEHPDRLIFIKAKDIQAGLNRFNRMAEVVNNFSQDTLYRENYGNTVISQINLEDLPRLLFGSLFSRFESCFYTTFDDYIVLGNNIPVIKSFLADYDIEDTWGKSVRQNLFLENTLETANYSLFINTERAWNFLFENLDPSWQQFFSRNASQFKSLELIALQFSNLDARFYSSIAVQYKNKINPGPAPQQFQVVQEVFTDAPIITKPFIVRNQVDRSFEVMLQDSTSNIYLIDKNGQILWKYYAGEAMIGEVYQIDFYNNNKLQYLFATPGAIHILDHNGNNLPGYPLAMNDSIQLEYLSLIDYDNSKRYRFLSASQQGGLLMFNKDRENLEGWNPNNLNPLAYPARHVRVRGRDCIIAAQKDGVINIMNRRGENMDNFPIDLRSTLNCPLNIEIGSDFESTRFSLIDQNGVLVQFNLNGKTLKAKQLYKPSRETTFTICQDALGKTFIIARKDYNRLSMLNREGELIFEKDYITSGDLAVQYYHLGADKLVYAVTDKLQEFTYIYDSKGELVNYQPLESGFEIGLIYSGNQEKYSVYSCFRDRFSISTFYRE